MQNCAVLALYTSLYDGVCLLCYMANSIRCGRMMSEVCYVIPRQLTATL